MRRRPWRRRCRGRSTVPRRRPPFRSAWRRPRQRREGRRPRPRPSKRSAARLRRRRRRCCAWRPPLRTGRPSCRTAGARYALRLWPQRRSWPRAAARTWRSCSTTRPRLPWRAPSPPPPTSWTLSRSTTPSRTPPARWRATAATCWSARPRCSAGRWRWSWRLAGRRRWRTSWRRARWTPRRWRPRRRRWRRSASGTSGCRRRCRTWWSSCRAAAACWTGARRSWSAWRTA
mmetsp:Transcript_22437/g.58497  ORF Transcript_22437/g.58497 Transcript_22437/m.58497 type:complete len:231 (+) Transcript_22437:100-792(+)